MAAVDEVEEAVMVEEAVEVVVAVVVEVAEVAEEVATLVMLVGGTIGMSSLLLKRMLFALSARSKPMKEARRRISRLLKSGV
jgi:phosphoribosyl-ATP pyrophosphohydrolase